MFFQNFVIFGKIFLKRTPFRLNLGQIFGSDLTKIDKQTWFIKNLVKPQLISDVLLQK